ncbi:NADH:ubiquinone oxidoreductase subunit J [Acidocella aquatica]|uniref:NADH-quinone oxidoreductase subunit J n=1 Tax=Acidocella aquatica TaxID=1922313 RepID=A0ABQ6A7A0_9PROT|nr:NADH-quinone oxidoreductase subunit J [Acidocella aquatica]GLR65999.1 NADH:ubiquinone oxidoreductase subunit J [Acidocella aquatica]
MNDAFYVASGIAVLSTALAITRANGVHALLYLVISLLAVALVFYTLGAAFAAALEVIVYAGAIIVLMVFLVMMLNLGGAAAARETQWMKPRVWIGPAILGIVLEAEIVSILARGDAGVPSLAVILPRDVGIAMFGPYLLCVELASMLLLAALAGAYRLAYLERAEG